MRRHRRAWLGLLVVFVLSGCNAAGRRMTEPAGSPPRVHETFTIPREVKGFCVIVPVRYERKTYPFILDTGTTGVILDEHFRPALGKPKTVRALRTASGTEEIELFDPPEVFLGPIDVAERGPVWCADLSPFRALSGCDIRGVVGMSVLKDYVVRIDFARSTVEIMSSDTEAHPEWGMAVPLGYGESCVPYVTALVDGREVRMSIDTGDNTFGRLSEGHYRRALRRRGTTVWDSTVVDLSGIRRGESVRIGELRLGHYIYRELPFSKGLSSAFGMAFLTRHRVTFDFPNRKMYLVKLRESARPGMPYISGLIFKRPPGGLVVHRVIPGGPAREVGIRPGDVVLKIDDTDASRLEPWRAARLLMSDREKEVTLTLERSGKTTTFSFRLRKGL